MEHSKHFFAAAALHLLSCSCIGQLQYIIWNIHSRSGFQREPLWPAGDADFRQKVLQIFQSTKKWNMERSSFLRVVGKYNNHLVQTTTCHTWFISTVDHLQGIMEKSIINIMDVMIASAEMQNRPCFPVIEKLCAFYEKWSS